MSDALRNRAYWNRTSDEYQERHGEFLRRPEPHWGGWQIPESELNILGDVSGKDMLELGCGAAWWSILLAKRGARPVGLDNSERQLEHARRLMVDAGVDFPLIHASAEDVPLADESFDVVFSDHGALSWSNPETTVPEAARLLRDGGLLAFCTTSPLAAICWDEDDDLIRPVLRHDYFGLRRFDQEEGVNFQLPYGEWIRLLRANGLVVEHLVEPRPAEDATSTYCMAEERDWARRWPSEAIWKARKTG